MLLLASFALAALAKAKQRDVQFLLPTDNTIVTPVKTDKLDKKGRAVIEFTNPRNLTENNIPDTEEGAA